MLEQTSSAPGTTAANPAAPSGGAETTDARARRPRGLVRKAILDALSSAREVLGTATKTDYAPVLAKAGINEAFVATMQEKVNAVAQAVAEVGRTTVEKRGTSKQEEDLKLRLLELIGVIQSKAKIKYDVGHPARAKYQINARVLNSRPKIEAAADSILATLKSEPLDNVTPEELAAFEAAAQAYMKVQTAQTGDHAKASASRIDMEASAKELMVLRRRIQYAVDACWPPGRKEHAHIRVEFKMNPDRLLR